MIASMHAPAIALRFGGTSLRPLAAPGVLRTAVVVVVLSLGLAALVRRSQVLGRAAGAGLLTSYVLFVTVQLR